jgi:hypothetical protein
MRIDRKWAMPNRRTFSIKPIKELIQEELPRSTLIIDPFAGASKIASITNDIDPQYDTTHHLDALDFLKTFDDESVEGVLFDPPYSPRQVSEVYRKLDKTVNMETTQASFWSKLKDEVSRIVCPGGTVISFGWNSGGIGKTRGFKIRRILLVPHGSNHYDTICTVETKIESNLSSLFKEDSEE